MCIFYFRTFKPTGFFRVSIPMKKRQINSVTYFIKINKMKVKINKVISSLTEYNCFYNNF